MEYNEVLDKLAKLERNLKRAAKRGDSAKVKKYKNDINDLKIQKEKLESSDLSGTILKQDNVISRLNEEVVALKETNNVLYEEIEKLKSRMNQILTPLAADQPESEPPKLKCPKCGHLVLESDMVEHQKNCIGSRQ